MQQMLLRPVKVHNLLIGENILVRCNVSNPALYHQFHDPVHINHGYSTTQAADRTGNNGIYGNGPFKSISYRSISIDKYRLAKQHKTGLFTPNAKKS